MSLYKKPILVPMTYQDLMQLISWLRTRIENGATIENLKIMIAFVDKLEEIAKEIRLKDDEEILRQINKDKKS